MEKKKINTQLLIANTGHFFGEKSITQRLEPKAEPKPWNSNTRKSN